MSALLLLAAALQTATAAPPLWIDPAWSDSSGPRAGSPRVTVWFDAQLLEGGDAYTRFTRARRTAPRSELRRLIIDSLKALNEASWSRAESAVHRLEGDGVVANCRRHWIVNSFTCDLPAGDPSRLSEVPGAAKAFRAFGRPPADPRTSPPYTQRCNAKVDSYKPDASHAPWNAQLLAVDRVWSELDTTGRGVMHVVHDFGWTFRPSPIQATLWCNPRETPGNNIDDDGNGLVDDVHGFDFDRGDAVLGGNGTLLPGGVTHGDLTAAVLVGREIVDTAVVVGIAPGGRWAAVVSSLSIEPGVEWALEQGADTYSMSFSLAGLGELRSHWRRVMEHGALAGLFFVSGAGNFANPDVPNYAPIPVQMRIPEDIPFAVFGVAGVGRDEKRPLFSSQGPVLWRTVEYNEGAVPKPDFATVNTNILAVDSLGRASYLGPNGWSGNSFAGPHTAGVIALMLEANPELTPWQVREILIDTARDVEAPGPDMQTGAGVLDAFRAVLAARARKANAASK